VQSGANHVVSMQVLTAVFLALVVLTGLTVAAAHVDLGGGNLVLALVIASVKASLVLLYFMHLRYDRPFNMAVFATCLAFVVLFISLVLTDTQALRATHIPEEAEGMRQVHTPFGQPTP
jgi:cytochrome c oxidase subunit IV